MVNGVVYFGSADGYVYAVSEADGRQRWRRRTGAGVQTVAATRSGLIVASLDNFVYLLSFRSGDRLMEKTACGETRGRASDDLRRSSLHAAFQLHRRRAWICATANSSTVCQSARTTAWRPRPSSAGKVLFVTTRHGLLAFSRPESGHGTIQDKFCGRISFANLAHSRGAPAEEATELEQQSVQDVERRPESVGHIRRRGR